uniref:G-protein coupled receptors family 1 profile domain-containing protein n=2 Tax=Equus asinus TaxID=9793 RepID=A0A8C4MZP1_EQUAS|nr:galanin receptor type 3-like [Equus asinus]XP_044631004.1 galanin receptor type 3-like [Equus asinus]
MEKQTGLLCREQWWRGGQPLPVSEGSKSASRAQEPQSSTRQARRAPGGTQAGLQSELPGKRRMEPNVTFTARLTATPEQRLRLIFAGACGLILLVGLLANGLMLLVVGQGPGTPRPLLALTTSLMVNITLSDLLFLSCVVPVLLLSFLRHDWWLGQAVCTTSQATNNATMFCTFYSMVATALLRHVAVARPDVALPCSQGARLLLCGAMWILGLTASLPNWLFQRVVVEEAVRARACLLLLSPAWTSCYFTLLGALAFLPCVLGLGCSFSHVGWLLWTRPRGPVGESIQEHRENTGLILIVLLVFVLMWGPCSVLGYVAAMGGLPATPTAFVTSGLCTILAYSNCAVSPILCFCLSRAFRAGLRKLFCRPMAARHPRGVGGAGMVMEPIQPGHDRAPGGLWGLAGV